MNRRYRRQMLLRSRRHRAGRLGACGCHPRKHIGMFITRSAPVPPRVITDSFCDPLWQLRRRRKVNTLPDISTVTEAMLKLAPVANTTSAYFKRLREVYDAESQ